MSWMGRSVDLPPAQQVGVNFSCFPTFRLSGVSLFSDPCHCRRARRGNYLVHDPLLRRGGKMSMVICNMLMAL